eukprot:scaffold14212_cov31-Tisochrysis_lutea.AAC.3
MSCIAIVVAIACIGVRGALRRASTSQLSAALPQDLGSLRRSMQKLANGVKDIPEPVTFLHIGCASRGAQSLYAPGAAFSTSRLAASSPTLVGASRLQTFRRAHGGACRPSPLAELTICAMASGEICNCSAAATDRTALVSSESAMGLQAMWRTSAGWAAVAAPSSVSICRGTPPPELSEQSISTSGNRARERGFKWLRERFTAVTGGAVPRAATGVDTHPERTCGGSGTPVCAYKGEAWEGAKACTCCCCMRVSARSPLLALMGSSSSSTSRLLSAGAGRSLLVPPPLTASESVRSDEARKCPNCARRDS